jgi:hypothetical protein
MEGLIEGVLRVVKVDTEGEGNRKVRNVAVPVVDRSGNG